VHDVEPDFQRAITVVLGAGAIIMGTATIMLVLAFRSFRDKPRLGLIAALLAFVLVCCAVLFAASYAAQR
jgi:hypothetical protein